MSEVSGPVESGVCKCIGMAGGDISNSDLDNIGVGMI